MSGQKALTLCLGLALGVAGTATLVPRPAAAEPRSETSVAGRYQVMHLAQFAGSARQDGSSNARDDRIVVLDTKTGQCWATSDEKGNEWRDLGSPLKPKK